MDLTRPPGRPKIRVMEAAPIGKKIRKERQAQGLSLGALSTMCGKSVQTISAIELGESQNPQVPTVLPISDALGIPPQGVYELLAGEPSTEAVRST